MQPQQFHESMSKILEQTANTTILLDCGDQGFDASEIFYTEEDLMNAVIVFNHIAGNIRIQKALDKGTLNDEQQHEEFRQESMNLGLQLRQWIIEMTGFDPHEYFSRLKSE